MPLKTRIADVFVGLANRRTERVARRQLAAELASFQTPAERTELEHMLGRHTAEETREIRAILTQQDIERQQRKASILGGYRI